MHYRMNNSNDYGHLRVRSNIVRLRGSQILSRVYLLPRSSSKTLNSPGDPSLASSGQHPDCSWIHLTNEPQSVSLLTNIRNPPHRDQNTLAFNQKYLIHLGKNIYKQLPTKYSQLNSCPLPDQQTNPKVLLLLFQISLKPLSRRWIEYLDIHWTITMRAL